MYTKTKDVVKALIGLILATIICFGFIGCGKTDTQNETEPDENYYIRTAVTREINFNRQNWTIDGNDIKSAQTTITNITKKEANDTIPFEHYEVNGKVTFTDIYGTNWYNKFDCEVDENNEFCSVYGKIKYKNEYWSKTE